MDKNAVLEILSRFRKALESKNIRKAERGVESFKLTSFFNDKDLAPPRLSLVD